MVRGSLRSEVEGGARRERLVCKHRQKRARFNGRCRVRFTLPESTLTFFLFGRHAPCFVVRGVLDPLPRSPLRPNKKKSYVHRSALRCEKKKKKQVVSLGHGCPLQLLESCQEGVRLYPLVERVRAYQEQGFASMVAFRRLNCPRPLEARARLEAFARLVEGKVR